MTMQVNRFSQEAKWVNWRNAFLWFQGIFYFFQGFYIAGNGNFIDVTLGNFGLTVEQFAAFSAAIGIPTYLKFGIGLLSDRVPFVKLGRRKPYIVIGGLLYIPAFAILFFLKEFNWLWIAAAMAVQIAWVMVDTTLDAMTVDVTPDELAGKMQGAANGARMAGMGLGILLVPLIGPRIGWSTTVVIIAIFAIIQAAIALLYRELPISKTDLAEDMALGKVLRNMFSKKIWWLSIIYSMFFMGSIGIGRAITAFLMTDLGWGKDPDLLAIFGSSNLVHYLATTAGALLVAPFLAKHKNNFKFFILIAVIFWLFILPWFLVGSSVQNIFWVYVAQGTYGIGRGMMIVLVYSIVMRVCPKSLEALMFATLTSAMNIGLTAITPNTIAFFTQRFGLAPSIFSTIPYTIIGLIALYFILKELAKRDQESSIPAIDAAIAVE